LCQQPLKNFNTEVLLNIHPVLPSFFTQHDPTACIGCVFIGKVFKRLKKMPIVLYFYNKKIVVLFFY